MTNQIELELSIDDVCNPILIYHIESTFPQFKQYPEPDKFNRKVNFFDKLAKFYKTTPLEINPNINTESNVGFNVLNRILSDFNVEKIPEYPEPQYSLKDIENLGGYDADFIQSIVDTFKRNTPNYLNQISLGLAKYEIDIVKKAAHELKPSLVIFLMHDAVKRIRSLEYETIQDSPNWQKMTHIFEELRKIVDNVIKELHSNSK